MKPKLIIVSIAIAAMVTSAMAEEPDSVYIMPFAETHNTGRSGMKLKWSSDGENWEMLCDGRTVIRSDWGSWKTMINPCIERTADGEYLATWQISKSGQIYAQAKSENLIIWERQRYFEKKKQIATKHSPIVKIGYNEMQAVINHFQYEDFKNAEYNERAEHDNARFLNLQPVNVDIKTDISKAKPISDMLIGVFFEDLSHAADGGLYAELIQNRDFEYCEDSFAREKNWTHDYAWSTSSGASLTITDIKPIHPNNKFYAVLDVTQVGGTLISTGFDGIYMKKGEKYDFSLFVSSIHSSAKKEFAEVRIVSKNGDIIAQNKISLNAKDWKQQTCTLIATADDTDARLEIMPLQTGTYALDMISLFPQNTFKGRKNGLRRDLAQLIADLQPRFIRFPGGCLAHGDGLDNMYDWKGSVGPLHERRHLPNIWHYHQTRGLGYFEYFQFCEDVGAEPLPIIAAGVSCQNSGLLHKSLIESGKMKSDLPELFSEGQQGGIPMDKMPQYIQDVLDLIEWANGNPRTSKWAKIRADAGHPAPFNLKYIGLGNEDMISEEFKIRFKMIYDVVKEYYPDITIIGTAGPDIKGIDYEEGWKYATELQVPIVDEHCYRPTGWYIYNQNFYDHYDRSKSKVYLGEWAARSYSHSQTSLESALAEALHMTNLERNGDIVCMTSYAPLLAKEGHIHWNPDLIYFNNSEVHPTASYYTQRMFGQNSGDEYIPAELNTDQQDRKVNLRIGQSVIRESKTGDIIIKLVNLLPISVNTNLYLPSLQGYNPIASTSILTGDIRSKTAIPVNGNLAIGEKFSYKMPQYSFTVIRITAK